MKRDPVTYPVVWPAFEWARETGGMELAVAECARATMPRPQKVTAILAACLETVDGQPADSALLRRLSIGTREWMLQQVAASCRPAQDWYEVHCHDCGAVYDVALDLKALPKTPAPQTFPVTHLSTAAGALAFEVPNGVHEEHLARNPAMGSAEFLRLCALDDAAHQYLEAAEPSDLTALEDALDAVTPETADTVSTTCPDCKRARQTRIDPLAYAFPPAARVLRDVHTLSSAYSWSEDAVLNLPTPRRQSYVSMVSSGARAL